MKKKAKRKERPSPPDMPPSVSKPPPSFPHLFQVPPTNSTEHPPGAGHSSRHWDTAVIATVRACSQTLHILVSGGWKGEEY